MFLSPLILILSLGVDRICGDPHTRYHPVAILGTFIGWWGHPSRYAQRAQKPVGILFWFLTVFLFTVPFLLFSWYAPWYLVLVAGPVLLKVCFALRSLEEHARSVADAATMEDGRERVQMLVSRDTRTLNDEQVLSAAYESVAENLNDSIIAPLFYFILFGLPGAAVYRAVNTMDAMLGYTDDRIRIGWFSARMDDIFSFIPARISGIVLLLYFACIGRFRPACAILKRDRHLRPGFNGGIPMALIAGGVGIQFDKPGMYRIGDPDRSLRAAGPDIIRAVRIATLLFVLVAACASVLWNLLSNV